MEGREMHGGAATETKDKYPANRGVGETGVAVTSETIGDFFKTVPSSSGKTVGHQLQLAVTDFGREILNNLPNSRERALALTKLQECWFFLNQGVINYL
jgi:hypothetical protein